MDEKIGLKRVGHYSILLYKQSNEVQQTFWP